MFVKLEHFNQMFDHEKSSMANTKELLGEPAIYQFAPSIFSGINGDFGSFMYRLGYLMWMLKGSNTLESISYYGDYMNMATDDGETLRGAYGPRMRMWIGPDALQEAININQDIDNDEDMVKPVGIDQLRQICDDLMYGMTGTVMNIFDPSLDFGETNNVPELQRVEFIVKNNKLHLVMNFMSEYLGSQMVTDVWAFSVIQGLLVSFLKNVGMGDITVIMSNKQGLVYFRDSEFGRLDHTEPKMFGSGLDFDKTTVDEFLGDFSILRNFETHLRMQIRPEIFENKEVSVPMIIDTFRTAVLNKISNKFIKEWGICLLLTSLMKYGVNLSKYQEPVIELIREVNRPQLLIELCNFIDYQFADNDDSDLEFMLDLKNACLQR